MTAELTDEFAGHKVRGRIDNQHCKTKDGLVLQGREVWAALPPHFTARAAGGDDGHVVVKQPGWLRTPNQSLEDKS